MNKTWCPKTAEKSLIDTVKMVGQEAESNAAAEMISAMAGGWKSKLIVEAWTNHGGVIASSIGLAIAAYHTGGRHVCIVPDEISGLEYKDSMSNHNVPMPEIVVGTRRQEFLEGLVSIDFLVIQGGDQDDYVKLLGHLKFCHLGAVLASNNMKISGFRWQRILDGGFCVVRSFALPNGLDVALVAAAAAGGGSREGKRHGHVRWLRHVDQQTGEEHILRR